MIHRSASRRRLAGDQVGQLHRLAPRWPLAVSPNYGFPQNGTVADPSFRLCPDAAMVTAAHKRGRR